jgi:hypothetical protein
VQKKSDVSSFEEAEKLSLDAVANTFASQLPHRRKDFGDQKFV